MNDPIFLTLDHILQIHAYQIEEHGGSAALLNMDLLESALAMPRQSFGDQYAHADLAGMAAAYLFHIVKNHAFEDGNKRAGVHASLIFLDLNGFPLDITDDDVVSLGIGIATGEMSKEGAAGFFRKHLGAK